MAGPVVRPGCDPGRGSTPPPTVRACRRVWRRSPGLPGHRRVGCVGCGSRSTVAGGWLPSLVPSWRRRRGGSGGWTGPRRWTPGGSSCPASRPTRPPWSRCSPGDRRSSCSTGRTTGSAARSSAKGSDAQQRRRPVSEMLAPLTQALPWLADRADALRSWDQVKLLEVRLDRLRRWHTDGLLCIGDAAHAMSPPVGLASTSPYRTRSPPPACSPAHCGAGWSPLQSWPGCGAGGCRPRWPSRDCNGSCTRRHCARPWRARLTLPRRARHRCRYAWSSDRRCCSGSRRTWSPGACDPSAPRSSPAAHRNR